MGDRFHFSSVSFLLYVQSTIMDFLEYLMANGIVENLDFFDVEVYSEDIERLAPEDEEELDPSKLEKRKETFSLYENEMVKYCRTHSTW